MPRNAKFWKCECGAVLLCTVGRPACPRAGSRNNARVHRPEPLTEPQPFDHLILPGACRRCGGAMVANAEEIAGALPFAHCARCGWSWFLSPADASPIRRFARPKKKGV